jgi:hypothetical protein
MPLISSARARTVVGALGVDLCRREDQRLACRHSLKGRRGVAGREAGDGEGVLHAPMWCVLMAGMGLAQVVAAGWFGAVACMRVLAVSCVLRGRRGRRGRAWFAASATRPRQLAWGPTGRCSGRLPAATCLVRRRGGRRSWEQTAAPQRRMHGIRGWPCWGPVGGLYVWLGARWIDCCGTDHRCLTGACSMCVARQCASDHMHGRCILSSWLAYVRLPLVSCAGIGARSSGNDRIKLYGSESETLINHSTQWYTST